jgi:hypothetical protein
MRLHGATADAKDLRDLFDGVEHQACGSDISYPDFPRISAASSPVLDAGYVLLAEC